MKTKANDIVAWAVLGVAVAVAFGAMVHMEWLLK